ncbi:MAG: hypothetical protein KAT09_01230 [Candidatus Aegiribacteria sp.]|nr:hypothetical protein [Candidatus Aegiribacteria sp.]
MICRNCGYRYDRRTVGFGTLCESCGEYLHTCFNCDIYDSKAERCRSLTTEAVSDRKSRNYCEEFVKNTDIVPGSDSGRGKTSDDFKTLFSMDGE